MKITANGLTGLMNDDGVRQLTGDLRSIVGAQSSDEAHVLLADADRCFRISAGGSVGSHDRLWVDPGCVTKLLTSITFFRVFPNGREALKSTVGQHLDVDRSNWISQLTVEQLLNHTHGIDEPGGWTLPLTPAGLIDLQSLLSGIGPERLSAPGELYSYSAIGYWLLAAILEARLGKPFLEVVRETFPGLLSPDNRGEILCPAYGRGVKVDAEEFLLQLVRATCHRENMSQVPIRLGAGLVQPHPGWHPNELGIVSGWKAYRYDWYGHKAVLHGREDVNVLVSPAKGLGILVCSVGGSQGRIIQGMFDETVFGVRRPATGTMGGSAPGSVAEARDPGVYDRLDSSIEVRREPGGLVMKAISKVAGARTGVPFVAALKRISGNLYSVNPPVPFLNLHIVELLRDRNSVASHLWNTGRVWRKVG